MRAPRPNTHLARLHAALLALVKQGKDVPSLSRWAADLDMATNYLRVLLEDGASMGLWKLSRAPGGIAAIYEPGGAWLVNGPASRAERRAAKPVLPPRKCLRCREGFAPDHRHNFLCVQCGIYAARTA